LLCAVSKWSMATDQVPAYGQTGSTSAVGLGGAGVCARQDNAGHVAARKETARKAEQHELRRFMRRTS